MGMLNKGYKGRTSSKNVTIGGIESLAANAKTGRSRGLPKMQSTQSATNSILKSRAKAEAKGKKAAPVKKEAPAKSAAPSKPAVKKTASKPPAVKKERKPVIEKNSPMNFGSDTSHLPPVDLTKIDKPVKNGKK
jgi:hypothetical protein